MLAALLLGGVAMPVKADAAFTPSGAITFSVDHSAKTITATVALAFYRAGCAAGTSCYGQAASGAVGAAEVARIVQSIEKMWNAGLKVKCYQFVVKVVPRSVGNQAEAGRSEIDIGLDYGPIPTNGPVAFVRGEVTGNQQKQNIVGNTPDDRINAVHDPGAPTTWPASTYEQVYAHEFGHIMGLDDNYLPSNPKLLAPGASEDLMFRKQGVVTDEMVKRVVDRSGQVNLKDLKCGWTILSTSGDGYHLTGTKCDDLDGEWSIHGVLDSSGVHSESNYTITIGAGSLRGTFKENAVTSVSTAVATTKANGTASVALQPDGTVKMTFDATTASGTANGQAVSGIPFPAQQFTWRPLTGTECSAPPP